MKFLSVALITALSIVVGCDRSPSDTDPSENVLQHRLNVKVQVLDPVNIGDSISHAVAKEIFECLYQYHYRVPILRHFAKWGPPSNVRINWFYNLLQKPLQLADVGTKVEIVRVNHVIRKQIAIENSIFERQVKL